MSSVISTGTAAGFIASFGKDWSNTVNILTKNDVTSATVVMDASETSDWLYATDDYSIIPADATINTITLRARVKSTHNSWVTCEAKLKKADNSLLAPDGTKTFLAVIIQQTRTYGGAGDTWSGVTLEDIRTAGFGVAVSMLTDIGAAGSQTASCNWIELQIEFTGASGETLGSFMKLELTNG